MILHHPILTLLYIPINYKLSYLWLIIKYQCFILTKIMKVSKHTALPQIILNVPFENHCYLSNYHEENDFTIQILNPLAVSHFLPFLNFTNKLPCFSITNLCLSVQTINILLGIFGEQPSVEFLYGSEAKEKQAVILNDANNMPWPLIFLTL